MPPRWQRAEQLLHLLPGMNFPRSQNLYSDQRLGVSDQVSQGKSRGGDHRLPAWHVEHGHRRELFRSWFDPSLKEHVHENEEQIGPGVHGIWKIREPEFLRFGPYPGCRSDRSVL